MLEALAFGHEQCKQIARIQKDLVAQAGKPQWAFDAKAGADPALEARVKELATGKVVKALAIHEKQARAQALEGVFEEVWAALGVDEALRPKAREALDKVEKAEVRRMIVEKGVRLDGRRVTEVRPIWSEIGYLPRVHGSALFTRGETQALGRRRSATRKTSQAGSFEATSSAA